MKMKWIMLVTLLLLAVLTIGAASAVDDNNVTSDDLQVSDEGDDVVELDDYDENDHYIEVYEEIDLNDDEDDVADIHLPTGTTKGYFQILNGEDEVAKLEVDPDNDDYWDDDGDELLGSLYVEDINPNKIKDGDTLSFMFLEYKNNQYAEFKDLTVFYKVKLTGSIMKLTEIGGEGDGEILVNDIALNNTDENFAFVNVTEREGTLIITVSTDNEDYVVFKENLKTTTRPYEESMDEEGTVYYCFAYSLADLNNYTAKTLSGTSFFDLINTKAISTDDEMDFTVLEDEDDEDSEIVTNSWTMIIKNGKIIFDDDEDDVEVDYDELDIVMDDGWNETVILEYTVKRGIKGNIVIYLNDDEAPAFNRSISECEPVGFDLDDEEDVYEITIADLNITEAGEYVLRYSFVDEKGVTICSYDEEDPEILNLIPSQIVTGDNATIWVNPVPISIDEDETVIKIIATDAHSDDEVIIYVDGNETPIIIKLDECGTDDNGNYTITSSQLSLGVGEHTLNITCKGTNALNKVTILTDLEIDFEELAYTTLNDAFVLISLEEKDITEVSDITGLVNVTITDGEGNVIDTIQKDIEDIGADFDFESLVIRTNDMNVNLNGTYTVSVTYFNGNKGMVQAKDNVTFKELGADDYEISINEFIDDDKIITFGDLPLDDDILISIDGNESLRFDKSSLSMGLDSENKTVYFIKQDQLNLTDGSHSVSVSIDSANGIINLANVNVAVNLKENIDPALTIAVSDIEVGNAATVLITTNSTFTGTVLVQVANKNYTVNVDKGKGNVTVTGLDVGTYTATAIFKADAFFNESTKSATFKVNAKPVAPAKKKTVIKLTLKKVKVKKSAKKLVLKATVKVNGKAKKGLKVTFKIKGKKVGTKKTNKKGVAKLTLKKKALKKALKKAKVGKKIKIQATCKGTTKTIKVKVKK